MQRQLELISSDGDADWRLDDETRAVGRRGVAAARAALAESRRPVTDDGDHRRDHRPAA